MKRFTLPIVMIVCGFVALGFLAGRAVADTPTTDLPVAAEPLLHDLFDGIANGDWFLVAGVALSLVTMGVRYLLVQKWPAWESDVRGVALTAALAGVGALANAWLADERVASTTTLVGALKVWAAAVFAYVTAKKLFANVIKPKVAVASIVVLLAASGVISCKPYLPPNTHPVVDCINADQARIKSMLDALWPKDGGRPDWGAIESQAIDAGIQIGGCVVAEFVQRYLAPPSGVAVPPPEETVAARDALERARKRAGGASFRFADGDR